MSSLYRWAHNKLLTKTGAISKLVEWGEKSNRPTLKASGYG